ncbi:MAG: ABC transporter permease [Firmicutes bacterium]|jgi:ABC-2 type transport system permease protein|nr:ABC transporter permease [Bacillota bacterium]NLO65614.1 ABC transporter permease [Bacillota bacterium]
MNKWIAFWNILVKDVKNYYFKPPNISWGIIFPFAWTLMFLLRSNTEVDIRSILPGVIAMSILFGTTSMLAVTITFERRSQSFERLLVAPIDIRLLMLAKTTGAIVFGLFNACVPILFSLFWISLKGITWLPLIAGVFLIAVTSAFLGLFVAVSVREVFEAQTLSNFFRFPMVFLCGLFIPVDQLPTAVRPLAYALPLTYGVDILKTAINNSGDLPVWFSLFVLVLFASLLFDLSIRNVERKWIL